MCGKYAANLVNSAARVRRIFAKCAAKVRRIFFNKVVFCGGKLLKGGGGGGGGGGSALIFVRTQF